MPPAAGRQCFIRPSAEAGIEELVDGHCDLEKCVYEFTFHVGVVPSCGLNDDGIKLCKRRSRH